jgi:small redox-active disulfide protein 2
MRIDILGPGCERCDALHERVMAAVAELGLSAEVGRVQGLRELAERGVAAIPALAIDGDVKVMGALLTVAQLKRILAPGAANP